MFCSLVARLAASASATNTSAATHRQLTPSVASMGGISDNVPSEDSADNINAAAAMQRRQWCEKFGWTRETLVTPAPVSSSSLQTAAVVSPSRSFGSSEWSFPDFFRFRSSSRTVGSTGTKVDTSHGPLIFASVDQLISFVKECLRSKPSQLFLKFMMHEQVTVDVWGRRVAEVVRAANRVRAMAQAQAAPSARGVGGSPSSPLRRVPQVTVFIDELNTAPVTVLALIKEAMVDGTHEGEKLPDSECALILLANFECIKLDEPVLMCTAL